MIVSYSSNDFSTAATRSSIKVGDFLFCKTWIDLKKLRSKTFKSGEFGGWLTKRISNPSCEVTRRNSCSSQSMCVFALSCYIDIGCPLSSIGPFSMIEGRIFSSTHFFYYIFSNGSYWFGLECTRRSIYTRPLAGSLVAKGNASIFPENISFPYESNLVLAMATKNMIFGM